MDFLTPLIGKRALSGAWIVEPPPVTPAVAEKLNALPSSTRLVRVRIRPGLESGEANIGAEVLNMAGRLINEIRRDGKCRVVVQRGEILRGSNVHGNHNVQTFEVGKTYELPVLAALRLLNADPMRYVFEEVSASGDTTPTAPITSDKDVMLREMQEQLRHLTERLAASEARAAAPRPSSKRTLKDALSDPAEGQE